MDKHYLHSSFREKLIEHLFVGELLKHSWQHRECRLEIAKPEVDCHGYDVIAEENGIVRHIQLKASHSRAKAAYQKVHIELRAKPSGCIVWIFFDSESLSLGPFLYFGGKPGAPLPDLSGYRVAKHTKGNSDGVKSERPSIRKVPKGQFTVYQCFEEVYEALFGHS